MIFTNLISTNLRTKIFGQEIEYYQILPSTNQEAWNLIEKKESNHGMIVITDQQKKGKGRGNNSWFMSPSKGLAMSIIIDEPVSLNDASLIPLSAGLSVAQAIENRGLKPKLKWPNDILINGKKCGGILCESKVRNGNLTQMVIGIGLNINEATSDFPNELISNATSMSIETGHTHQRELFCAIITTFFERNFEVLQKSPTIWTKYCYHLDKTVSFKQNGKNISGIFRGLNNNGYAKIDINGIVKIFPSITLD